MPNQVTPPYSSKRRAENLARERQERERKTRNWLIAGSVVVIVLAISGLAGPSVFNNYIFPNQPVAKVASTSISTRDWQVQVRYNRLILITQYEKNAQVYASLGMDPSSLIADLKDPKTLGGKVLDQMIDDVIIRDQAAKLGIQVPASDIDLFMQNTFLFYPKGTPRPSATPTPWNTPTLNPTEQFLLNPTSGLTSSNPGTETPSANRAPFEQPAKLSTPYTISTYQAVVKTFVAKTSDQGVAGFSDAALRSIIEAQVYRQKVMEFVTKDITSMQDQVWARHIVLGDQASASAALERLKSGQDWNKVCAELSLDAATKNKGGDLGWFPKGVQEPALEKAAFSLPVGQFSDPVKTKDGWEIIQILGHEGRPVDDSLFLAMQNQAFQDWLDGVRKNYTITKYDYWQQRVPTDPTLTPPMTATP